MSLPCNFCSKIVNERMAQCLIWCLALLILLSNDVETNPGPLRIACQNIRSMAKRSNYLQLKMELTGLAYDIYGITETWLHENIKSDDVSINGYKFYRVDRPNKIGGGVGAYVSTKFKVQVLTELCKSDGGIEQMWLK